MSPEKKTLAAGVPGAATDAGAACFAGEKLGKFLVEGSGGPVSTGGSSVPLIASMTQCALAISISICSSNSSSMLFDSSTRRGVLYVVSGKSVEF